MMTETKQKGWAAFNEDGTKALSVQLGGIGYQNRYSLTVDVNKAHLTDLKFWMEMYTEGFNRTHKNQINFQIRYVERTITATLRCEKEPEDNS